MKVNVALPPTCLTIGVIVLSPLAWPQTAHAGVVESYWIPLTGDYEDPANWSGPVPDETVTAVFDISFDPQPGPFIFFNAGHTSDRVIVRAGQAWFGLWETVGSEHFSLSYQLMNPQVAEPSLVVGELAATEASLTIFAGALNTEMTVIGLDPGSVGAIDFGGIYGLIPGLSTRTKLHVGDGGQGLLIMDDDTIVSCGSAVIGVQPGSSGQLIAAGTGASFSTANVLAVGLAGDGVMDVSNDAVVASGSAIVAQAQASVGEVVISGASSSWTMPGTMMIGGGGQAAMTISDDAEVASGSTIIGQQFGAVGDVTVTGLGTSWTITGSLDVGMMGTGNLTICDGGAVFTDETFVTIGTFPVLFGDEGGVGVVTVCGPGSIWFVDGDLYVGFISSGTLAVLDGATVISQNAVVGFDNTQSAAHVDGFGSLWSNAGPLQVNTVLTVTDGGRVFADSVFAEELEGDGIVQTVAGATTASVTRVGNPVGTLTIDGGFSGAQLLVDIAAAVPGGYDRLSVTGTAQVGSVTVTLLGGYVPQAGDTFVVITSNAMQGVPDVTLPGLPEPLTWLVNHDGSSLELLVSKLGDVNGDGVVNVVDLLELLGLWGACPATCPADFNGDGDVGVPDLLILLGNVDFD